VLDPDVVVRSEGGALRAGATAALHGAETVASNAIMFRNLSPFVRPALVNGVAGVVVAPNGRPYSVIAFTVRGGKIVAIDALADPKRLQGLDLAVLGE
jgi:RNA polymerase sigma-70 factor (ECF subfamily)